MTMSDPPSEPRAGVDVVSWLHDQVAKLKTQVGRMQQQNDQLQAAIGDVNEALRDAENRLREMAAKKLALPTMQDQLRQVSGLLERIQDAEVLIDTKFEILERQGAEERGRDQSEKNELYKRVQDLERRAEGVVERQAGVEESSRRTHEDISRVHVQYQSLNQ